MARDGDADDDATRFTSHRRDWRLTTVPATSSTTHTADSTTLPPSKPRVDGEYVVINGPVRVIESKAA